jgi:phosphatidylserine/phosphatidylglycerophosphate/cardiolipin synthase-like enzyme
MSAQKLTAFEQMVVAALADKAALAALVLDAWSLLPADAPQTARSLVNAAQLGLTEESATAKLLMRACGLGLAKPAPADSFLALPGAHIRFSRLSFALHAIEYYRSAVHRDATLAQVVLTKPARPSVLEQKLSDLGWRTADIEPTEHAFHALVRSAQSRVVVMTPFFDTKGAIWLQELLALVVPGVERILVLRSLEDTTRKDYPTGFEHLAPWLKGEAVKVFNYSLSRPAGGRETFHAKAVLCDRTSAYLGSSNVNTASLEHSMEMGVLLHGRAAAGVADVVDAVLSAASPWM